MKLHHLFEARKTLYVSRKLLNADAIYDWAKEQGIEKILEKSDIHVTLIYCEKRIEWDDGTLDKKSLRIKGGKREMDIFGDDALVLKFKSRKLQTRFEEFLDIGAESKYPEYNPHVSISYDAQNIKIDDIEPYRGELHFGPEVWKIVDKNWSDNLEEVNL